MLYAVSWSHNLERSCLLCYTQNTCRIAAGHPTATGVNFRATWRLDWSRTYALAIKFFGLWTISRGCSTREIVQLRNSYLRNSYLRNSYLRNSYLRNSYLRNSYLSSGVLPNDKFFFVKVFQKVIKLLL
ncbi:pentapeptide repeat-containing protein [Leptolyngbya sp. O-77]|uniref:pentapeptide repeat-containing protein n=1 Tax=Leptolyngbya sp. O-77 TaxID=1080068 RepID=UPI000A0324F0